MNMINLEAPKTIEYSQVEGIVDTMKRFRKTNIVSGVSIAMGIELALTELGLMPPEETEMEMPHLSRNGANPKRAC